MYIMYCNIIRHRTPHSVYLGSREAGSVWQPPQLHRGGGSKEALPSPGSITHLFSHPYLGVCFWGDLTLDILFSVP